MAETFFQNILKEGQKISQHTCYCDKCAYTIVKKFFVIYLESEPRRWMRRVICIHLRKNIKYYMVKGKKFKAFFVDEVYDLDIELMKS